MRLLGRQLDVRTELDGKMTSLVLELQRDALDRTIKTTALLRKALVVARKLKVEDIVEWLGHELNGYPQGAEVPSYRFIHGEVKAHNPYNGWIPLFFSDARRAESLSKRGTSQSLSELESIAEAKDENGLVYFNFPKAVEAKLMKGMEFPMKPVLMVSMSQVHGLIDRVRNNVLDWALGLEEKGVKGEGMSFSAEEKQQAGSVTINVGNVIGSMSDSQIQQETSNSTQSYKKILDFEATRNVLSELKSRMAELELDAEDGQRLQIDLACIESQLESPQPNVTVVRECLRSLRGIVEGAAGSALFQSVLTAIAALT